MASAEPEFAEPLFGDSKVNEEELTGFTDHLFGAVMGMGEHRGKLFLDGLKKHLALIGQEGTSAATDGFYKRGQVVHVELGFNVGSEEGGERPAVVVWAEPRAGTITIVPLTSLKKGKAHKDLGRPAHVNLGELLHKGRISIAKVQQIRAVSKLRVKPWAPSPGSETKTILLSDEQLDAIDAVVSRMYTEPKP